MKFSSSSTAAAESAASASSLTFVLYNETGDLDGERCLLKDSFIPIMMTITRFDNHEEGNDGHNDYADDDGDDDVNDVDDFSAFLHVFSAYLFNFVELFSFRVSAFF